VKFIDIIAGARPNFMKIAPIIRAIEAKNNNISYRLIHTGQHYDSKLSGSFFKQLGIPKPGYNLQVGSGTQAQQCGAIMERYEEILLRKSSNACLVVGDVNSTMACAIAAQKLCIPVAHVEAGIRSGDWSMPEEINRLVTDSITNWFFTTSENANQNLVSSGVDPSKIFFVGNTMIDTLYENLNNFSPPDFWDRLCLKNKKYFVVTLHRPANVDGLSEFSTLLRTIAKEAGSYPVIFPVHPRTANTLNEMDLIPENIKPVDPQPYLQFNYLVKNAIAVITDSGGITEETTVLGVPCMTLRDNTERPETISIGTNELLGTNPSAIKPAMSKLFAGKWKSGSAPELWDGKAATRIVNHLEDLI
jgi:UDP-N-acetylglucosamine 2-epimerase (non-hydrolysing)